MIVLFGKTSGSQGTAVFRQSEQPGHHGSSESAGSAPGVRIGPVTMTPTQIVTIRPGGAEKAKRAG